MIGPDNNLVIHEKATNHTICITNKQKTGIIALIAFVEIK